MGKLSVYTLQNLRHSGKLYPASGKTFPHMNKTKLFDLSKCFLGNRDNFCPYEQALTNFNRFIPMTYRKGLYSSCLISAPLISLFTVIVNFRTLNKCFLVTVIQPLLLITALFETFLA